MKKSTESTLSEKEALREFSERYAARVYGRCRYIIHDEQEAEDAMQDVFIKAMKNLDGFRQEAAPLTWLTRIATNHCLNIIRAKRAPWHEKYKTEVKVRGEGENSAAIRFAEDDQLLQLCLRQVDKDLAEIAIYHFVDEMNQAEICKLVNVSAPTLRKRLRSFIDLSRDAIRQEMPNVDFRPALVCR
ncbi:MAG: sigma-70 family RNA polymerase sigma factor [Deltaproteobacteria bacterium]|nr:sigma-70 family RNA polymerase sigma factor [Deltaproteobacteria bacterium]